MLEANQPLPKANQLMPAAKAILVVEENPTLQGDTSYLAVICPTMASANTSTLRRDTYHRA